MPRLVVVPCYISEAADFIEAHHRHNRRPVGGLFACAVEEDGVRVGVGLASRPVARMTDARIYFEITRCCTTGAKNAPSMLYGALCSAGFALGYRRAVTYTRADEPGTSLRAANFVATGDVAPASWHRDSNPLRTRKLTLFGEEVDDIIAKTRWERWAVGRPDQRSAMPLSPRGDPDAS